MGFFNFLYKLSNIFTNKRRLKFFIVVGIVLLIIFGCSKGVFAYTTDSTPSDAQALMNYQLALQQALVSQLRYQYYSKPSGYDAAAMKNLTDKLYWYNVYVTPGDYSGNNNCLYNVFTYSSIFGQNDVDIFTTPATWSVGENSGTAYDCMIADFTANSWTKVMQGGGNRVSPVYSGNSTTIHLPDACYMVRSCAIDDFLVDIGYGSGSINTTYNTNDDELQAIASSGFFNVANSIQQQTNTMTNSINSASSSITNSINSVENTLTDTATDDEQVAFASENNQDLTSGFFTNLYLIIQNNFTANIYKVVSFPIPFTNKTMSFSNDYFTNNIYTNQQYTTLVTLARSCWWFSLGYYVILDIYKKINKLKSGDLTNIENENITTDLL